MTPELTKKLIDRGLDKNILAYDSGAKPKDITIRLIGIMRDVTLRQYKKDLRYLFIPSVGITYDDYEWDELSGEMEYPVLGGLQLVTVESLNPDGKFLTYYLKKGCLALKCCRDHEHDDDVLVVGLGESNSVMLGSC